MNWKNAKSPHPFQATFVWLWALLTSVWASSNIQAQTTDLIDFYARLQSRQVMVAAHRGDWFNYPENSLPAIQSCIDMGVDVVEVDVRMTKDGHFILMHDETVDRTTNGRGKVGALTLDYIQGLRLKDRSGRLTDYVVPTLEEVTAITRDRIVVNLDKSVDHLDELLIKIDSLDACFQYILKANRSASFFAERFEKTAHFPCIMPILSKKDPAQCAEFLIQAKPRIVELISGSDTTSMTRTPALKLFSENQCGIWYNSLFPAVSMGWDENKNSLQAWTWFIEHQASVIQTDRPRDLIQFLIDNHLR